MGKILVVTENKKQFDNYVASHGFDDGVAIHAVNMESVRGVDIDEVVMIGRWNMSPFANDPECFDYLVNEHGMDDLLE